MHDAVEFELGQKVYQRCNPDNEFGFVTGIVFRANGHTFYVTWKCKQETAHFAFELSTEAEFSPVAGE